MSTAPQTQLEEAPESRLQEIRASLQKLERRDWWLWVLAIVVMLLLTVAVVSLSFPNLLKSKTRSSSSASTRLCAGWWGWCCSSIAIRSISR